MAIPIVNLRKIRRRKGFVYQLDYAINGIRKREIVGSNKNTAEVIKSKIQTDIALGYRHISLNRFSSFTQNFLHYLIF